MLYILQHCPYKVPEGIFISIDAQLRLLLWGGPPRIAVSALQRYKFEGGIALPNLRKYYEATQVCIINDWTHAEQNKPACEMDRWGMGGYSYMHALYGEKL